MTKSDLVASIASASDISKKAANAALDAITSVITDELKKGNSVALIGFGTFKVSERAARKGVNPRNPSEKIEIPATKLPTFKAGKSLKEAVR